VLLSPPVDRAHGTARSTNAHSLLLVILAFSAVAYADEPAATSTRSRSEAGAAARPDVERQRQEAEQQARNTLDQEAIDPIQETQNAVKAIAEGKNDQAIAAIERAAGKINLLVARNPSTALLPDKNAAQSLLAAVDRQREDFVIRRRRPPFSCVMVREFMREKRSRH
jgi:hypothetical protein